MGATRYAAVAVEHSLGARHPFTYAIPPNWDAQRGDLVVAPFGRDMRPGVVISVQDEPPDDLDAGSVKPLARVLEPRPALDAARMELAEWMAEYYQAPLYQACAAMLPPGLGDLATALVTLSPNAEIAALKGAERRAAEALAAAAAPLERRKLARMVGRGGDKAVAALLKGGLAEQEFRIAEAAAGTPTAAFVAPAADRARLRSLLETGGARRYARRTEIAEWLLEDAPPMARADAVRRFGAAALKWAVEEGAAEVRQIARDSAPGAAAAEASVPPQPSEGQRAAMEAVGGAIGGGAEEERRPFLLFGSTGSGKTEVYMGCVARCLERGLGAIVLVPEIALSPPMLEQFEARFPGKVAALHSGLTPAQRRAAWARIRAGERPVVLGARSAVFAPVPRLGLIVMDEEHEWTYKQVEGTPLYHARTVALRLARITGAALLLGSATPDVGSFRNAERGEYRLLRLSGKPFLPADAQQEEQGLYVRVVDMRRATMADPGGVISRALDTAIGRALDVGGKVILFINRLGTAALIQCRECGEAEHCRQCDARLVLHEGAGGEARLRCHYCGHSAEAGGACRACGGARIRRLMPGVQAVERALNARYPDAGVLRWDSDVAQSFKQHKRIIDRFASDDAHILVGTQLVIKGLDIHAVRLAGVISADSILMTPDFRSDERLFQAVTQLMGRAGRGHEPGAAIIQTYAPEHYAVETASRQDYEGFYAQALEVRARHTLPPYSRFVKLICSGYSAERVRDAAKAHALELQRRMRREGHSEMSIFGPAPLYPFKVRNRYRMQLVVKGPDPLRLVQAPPGQDWRLDAEPLNLG